jgi:hypothetical protein
MATYSMELELLPYALKGLEQRRDEIGGKIAEIRLLLGHSTGVQRSQPAARKATATRKRVLSPEARERIAQAQRDRWAASKKASAPVKTKASTKATKKAAAKKVTQAVKKRTMSAEARERIAAAQRKRWAASRKQS